MAWVPRSGSSPVSWRRWNAAIHRDLGYLVVGMTLVYAVSGLAVNHMADWNPNYHKVLKTHTMEPLPRDLPEAELARLALQRLKAKETLRSAFQPDEDTLQIFVQGGTYSVDLPSGKVLFEGLRPRPVLEAMNRLHLNAPKRLWTYLADLYALALIVVSLTGLFILRGRQGLAGRGAWLTGLGALVPLGYWLWWSLG